MQKRLTQSGVRPPAQPLKKLYTPPQDAKIRHVFKIQSIHTHTGSSYVCVMAGPVEEFSTSRGSNVFASVSKFRLLIHFSLTSRNSISLSTLCIKPSFTSRIPSSGYMSAASSPVDPHSNQIQIPLSQEVSHAKVSTFESQHQL